MHAALVQRLCSGSSIVAPDRVSFGSSVDARSPPQNHKFENRKSGRENPDRGIIFFSQDQSRAKMPRGIGQGGIGAAIKSFKERTRTAIRKPETWDADETWRMEDEDDCVGYVEETPRKNLTQQSRSKPGVRG